jgi:predicted DNA-binding protein YlxM (UPF0122 family)
VKVFAFTVFLRRFFMGYEKNLGIGALSEIYGAALTERQREFIRMYYDCDISLQEIGEMCGISRQAVRDAIVRGERELIRFEELFGFDRKRKEIIEQCKRLEELFGGADISETDFEACENIIEAKTNADGGINRNKETNSEKKRQLTVGLKKIEDILY